MRPVIRFFVFFLYALGSRTLKATQPLPISPLSAALQNSVSKFKPLHPDSSSHDLSVLLLTFASTLASLITNERAITETASCLFAFQFLKLCSASRRLFVFCKPYGYNFWDCSSSSSDNEWYYQMCLFAPGKMRYTTLKKDNRTTTLLPKTYEPAGENTNRPYLITTFLQLTGISFLFYKAVQKKYRILFACNGLLIVLIAHNTYEEVTSTHKKITSV